MSRTITRQIMRGAPVNTPTQLRSKRTGSPLRAIDDHGLTDAIGATWWALPTSSARLALAKARVPTGLEQGGQGARICRNHGYNDQITTKCRSRRKQENRNPLQCKGLRVLKYGGRYRIRTMRLMWRKVQQSAESVGNATVPSLYGSHCDVAWSDETRR